MQKRYLVTTSFYLYADNDADAKDVALAIAAKQAKKFDDCCTVDELAEAPFGSLKPRKININTCQTIKK